MDRHGHTPKGCPVVQQVLAFVYYWLLSECLSEYRIEVLKAKLSMELTIEQALKQAVEAHKAGKVQEADRLYTAILKAQPNHPDANHNLGILAVGVGKANEALPFLKKALEANADIAQFWLSYIDVLIKLDRIADAKAVLDQAKSKGAKGDGFVKLDQRLQTAGQVPLEVDKVAKEPQPTQPNILDSLKLDQAIKIAKKNEFDGALEEAKRIYQDVLLRFPKNNRAKEGLKRLDRGANVSTSKIQDPPEDHVQSLINLYNQGQLEQAFNQADTLIKHFPNSATLYNIQGAVLKAQRQLDLSVDAYNKALAIKPDYAEAHNNIGTTLKEQGKLEEAIEAYEKALTTEPDFANAYYNMGNALQEQGKLEEAIEAYKKALDIKPDDAEFHKSMGNTLLALRKPDEAMQSDNEALTIKPDFAEAHNNIGAIFQTQGELKEAINAFNKALSFKPDDPFMIMNVMSLSIQLFDNVLISEELSDRLENLKTDLFMFPKFQILQAIKAFILADKNLVIKHLKEYERFDPKTLSKLSQNDQVFNSAYYGFLSKLIQPLNFPEQHLRSTDIIFHLGESHCLSYAHQTLTVNSIAHKVVPKITFGGKVFHFNSENRNQYKAITKSNLESLPNGAKVLISFGEIDCRSNEGFIPAAEKLDKQLEELIDQTTENYVKWFFDQNVSKGLQLYFMNVPAPVYNNQHSANLNSTVARAVVLFNTALKKYSLKHGFGIVDVFKFTAGNEGFSNGLFHIDTHHLGAKALGEIQLQLS